MDTAIRLPTASDRLNLTAGKVKPVPAVSSDVPPDSLAAWRERYRAVAVAGVRSAAVAGKIGLHLARFVTFFRGAYGHDRLSTCLRRDVLAWQAALVEQGLAAATINNHLASISGFATWIQTQAPALFPHGNPTKGVGDLSLPPLEPRALTADQVRSLKNGGFGITPQNGAFGLHYSSSSIDTSGCCAKVSTSASTSIGSGPFVNS